jgi:hypothetical protein
MTRAIRPKTTQSFHWWGLALALTACLPGPLVSAPAGQTRGALNTFIQIPRTLKLKDQIYHDLDGDGLKDLVLSVGHRETPYRRSLRIHYQDRQDQDFKMTPDETIDLTPDVIAYACADVAPDPGCEILLLTANACFGHRLGRDGRDALFKVADHDFLWQLPDKDHVFSWQRAVLDFNNDHQTDLFLPEADGFRILLQDRFSFKGLGPLKLPEEDKHDDAQGQIDRVQSSLRASLGLQGSDILFGESANGAPLITLDHSIHVPLFADFNGDALYDIVAQTKTTLHVWQQAPARVFGSSPTLSLKLPKDDAAPPRLDIAANQYVVDLNRDGRCDFILCTKDRTSKKLSTQILIYLNHKDAGQQATLFGAEGLPHQLLKIAGLPSKAQLRDINGDGYPDLSFVTLRPDLLDQVKTLASERIELQLLAYLNHNGRFSRRPDLTQSIYVPVDGKGASQAQQGRFLLDYDQNGLQDLLVRDTRTHVGIRLLRRAKNGMVLAKAYAWQLNIPEDARIIPETDRDREDGPPDRETGSTHACEIQMTLSALAILLASFCPPGPPQAPAPGAEARRLAVLSPQCEVAAYRFHDLNADARDELFVVGTEGQIETWGRKAEQGGGFQRTGRDWTLPLPNASLLSFCSFSGHGTTEVLLALTPEGLWAYPGTRDGSLDPAGRLVNRRMKCVFRLGRPMFSNFLQDINQDGRMDILVPVMHHCEIWLNKGLPEDASASPRRQTPLFSRLGRFPIKMTYSRRTDLEGHHGQALRTPPSQASC